MWRGDHDRAVSAPRLHDALRHLAANVQRARAKRGKTQAELAEAADLDLRFVQRIERAATTPSVATVVALSEALDCPLSALFKPAKMPAPRTGRPSKRRRARPAA